MPETTTRAGTVALIGLPNAGKSSLLNRFLGSKLSIVTPFAQTTREKVVGIETRDDVQMVFLDTPGIVTPAYLLHRSMAGIVEETIADADVLVLVVDATAPPPAFSEEVAERLSRSASRLIVALNKVDAASPSRVKALEGWARATFGLQPTQVSAETGEGLEILRAEISARLPVSPYLYPEDELSSQSVRFFVAELIRESVFELYHEEIPYSVAVKIDEFAEELTPIRIRATIYVERASQKGILIGRQGSAMRQLGTVARAKIEEFVGAHVFLELWVKVLPKWRKSALELRRLGFPVPGDQD